MATQKTSATCSVYNTALASCTCVLFPECPVMSESQELHIHSLAPLPTQSENLSVV